MINLPPADWKHIQAQIAAASKQSMMHAGTHLENIASLVKSSGFFRLLYFYFVTMVTMNQ